MYVIREVFTAKPGMASKLAKLFKDAFAAMPTELNVNVRVLTDAIGPFNTVVLEHEAESLTAFEARMKEYMSRPEIGEPLKGYTDMYLTGSREIYRVM